MLPGSPGSVVLGGAVLGSPLPLAGGGVVVIGGVVVTGGVVIVLGVDGAPLVPGALTAGGVLAPVLGGSVLAFAGIIVLPLPMSSGVAGSDPHPITPTSRNAPRLRSHATSRP
jgi:hypothetical protein